jgi:hypothetical protein
MLRNLTRANVEYCTNPINFKICANLIDTVIYDDRTSDISPIGANSGLCAGCTRDVLSNQKIIHLIRHPLALIFPNFVMGA